MADIKKRGPLNHLRSEPTRFVRHLRKGEPARQGTGLAFWFRPLNSAISEVPVDERELPLFFHARTRDFQDAVVQATLTYRVADPVRTAERVDFSIDPHSGVWRSTPLEQIGGMLTELSQQHAVRELASRALIDALVEGIPVVRTAIEEGLRSDDRLDEVGIQVVGVRVIGIRPDTELDRALQMPVREDLQQEADKATFQRRALAVEQERAISENELQNQIELAKREQQLVVQRGANNRREAAEEAAAGEVTANGQASTTRILGEARADAERLIGEAAAHSEAERLRAYREVSEPTLLALTVKELAGNLPSIDTLVLTPDMLTSAIAGLVAAGRAGKPIAGTTAEGSVS